VEWGRTKSEVLYSTVLYLHFFLFLYFLKPGSGISIEKDPGDELTQSQGVGKASPNAKEELEKLPFFLPFSSLLHSGPQGILR
jgi:hypothetical protein